MSSYTQIYRVVRAIPYGRVATYGQIADLAGLIGKPRVVGYALYRVTAEQDVPWHRVINAKGEVSRSSLRDGNDDLQQFLLAQEGITFVKGKIDLRQYRWQPDFASIDQLLEENRPVDARSPKLTTDSIVAD